MSYKIAGTIVLEGVSLNNIDSIDATSIASLDSAASQDTVLTATMYNTVSDVPASADLFTFHYIRDIKRLQFYDSVGYKFIGFGVEDGF